MLVLQVESIHGVRHSLEILERSVHPPQSHPLPSLALSTNNASPILIQSICSMYARYPRTPSNSPHLLQVQFGSSH